MASEKPGQTLDATALVHEAWLKLANASVDWQDRTHFMRTAATAMRRILVLNQAYAD
jgi:RNA polymerase sigma-70 factor, ECF subfamily